jgi:hypothetical protein
VYLGHTAASGAIKNASVVENGGGRVVTTGGHFEDPAGRPSWDVKMTDMSNVPATANNVSDNDRIPTTRTVVGVQLHRAPR